MFKSAAVLALILTASHALAGQVSCDLFVYEEISYEAAQGPFILGSSVMCQQTVTLDKVNESQYVLDSLDKAAFKNCQREDNLFLEGVGVNEGENSDADARMAALKHTTFQDMVLSDGFDAALIINTNEDTPVFMEAILGVNKLGMSINSDSGTLNAEKELEANGGISMYQKNGMAFDNIRFSVRCKAIK